MKKKARKYRGKMNINRKNGRTGTDHAQASGVGSLTAFLRGKPTKNASCGTFGAHPTPQEQIDQCYREFVALRKMEHKIKPVEAVRITDKSIPPAKRKKWEKILKAEMNKNWLEFHRRR